MYTIFLHSALCHTNRQPETGSLLVVPYFPIDVINLIIMQIGTLTQIHSVTRKPGGKKEKD